MNLLKALSNACKALSRAQLAESVTPLTAAVWVLVVIKPFPLYSQRPALDNYSLALNLLLISLLLSPVTKYTVNKLELGNLDNLDNLNMEKDIKNTIFLIID